MLYDIVEVKVTEKYRLHLRFENGVEGEIDISEHVPFKGIFAKLKNPAYFSTVAINKELGTIVWENGADISPEYLYSVLSSKAA